MVKIKIIIHDGITINVLSDGMANVEIVDIDSDYEDYDALCAYEANLLNDSSLSELPFTAAHFGEEGSD